MLWFLLGLLLPPLHWWSREPVCPSRPGGARLEQSQGTAILAGLRHLPYPLAFDIDLLHLQMAVPDDEIGNLARFQRAIIPMQTQDGGGRQGSHTHGVVQGHSRLLMQGANAMVQAHDAGGQGGAVAGQTDTIGFADRFATILGPEDVVAIRLIDGSHRIGDNSQSLRPFDLVSQSQQFRCQMLAIGDHLGGQLIVVEGSFQYTAPHGIGLRLPQTRTVRHGTEQVINVTDAPFHRGSHLIERGVAVSDVEVHSFGGVPTDPPFPAGQLGSNGNGEGKAAVIIQQGFSFGIVGREKIPSGVTPTGCRGEKWPVQVSTDDTRPTRMSTPPASTPFQKTPVIAASGHSAGRRQPGCAVADMAATDGPEGFLGTIHEVRPVPAVNVQVDQARAHVVAAQVHDGGLLSGDLPHGLDPRTVPADVPDTNFIGKDQCRVGQNDGHFV